MNRLQKKCFVASSLFHGSLILLVAVGSAFLPAKREAETPHTIQMLSPKLVDDILATGGDGRPPASVPAPVVETPVAQPTPPVATPPERIKVVDQTPKPVETLKPAPVEIKKPAPEPEPLVEKPVVISKSPDAIPIHKKKPTADKPVADKPKPEKKPIAIDLSKTKKRTNDEAAQLAQAKKDAADQRRKAEAEAARVAADNARRVQEAYQQRVAGLSGAMANIQRNASSGTSIEIPGTGGEGFADYGASIQGIYERAWNAPSEVTDSSLKAQVKIVIASDGKILSSSIVRRSGIPALDKSVQRALDSVRAVPPFPSTSRDSQRTFLINFNLKAKRLLG